MEFQELKTILKRLFKEYVKKHMKRILIDIKALKQILKIKKKTN